MPDIERAAVMVAIAAAVESQPDPDGGLRLIDTYHGTRGEGFGIAADTSNSVVMALLNLAADYDRALITRMADTAQWDSYGYGVIGYFPGYHVTGVPTRDLEAEPGRYFCLFSVGGQLCLAHVRCATDPEWAPLALGSVRLALKAERNYQCPICHLRLHEVPPIQTTAR